MKKNATTPKRKDVPIHYWMVFSSLMIIALMSIFISSCKKNDLDIVGQTALQNDQYSHREQCGSMEVLEAQLKQDPSLESRMNDIEKFTQSYVKRNYEQRLSGDTIIIPVVVNVLYRITSENISDAQIRSQIDVLNEDFAATNPDIDNVPSLFRPVTAADTKIRFVLDRIIRKSTTVTSWSTNNYIKKSINGGIDATSPTTMLNIWVGTLSTGMLGYAQFPGGTAATDGVVILNRAFGSRLKFSGGNYLTNFDRGRTATHEIGHWMNIRHIWGSGTCGDDMVGDTPQANASNTGCPTFPHYSTCTGTPIEMTMNFMDYTNDACMNMFTAGQRSRMQAVFAIGGPRASFR